MVINGEIIVVMFCRLLINLAMNVNIHSTIIYIIFNGVSHVYSISVTLHLFIIFPKGKITLFSKCTFTDKKMHKFCMGKRMLMLIVISYNSLVMSIILSTSIYSHLLINF